ncbi:MAG: Ig-like domain-containing protein [Candidatus Paceibacteria bacterium]
MNLFILRNNVSAKAMLLLALVSLILTSLPLGAMTAFAEDVAEASIDEVVVEQQTSNDELITVSNDENIEQITSFEETANASFNFDIDTLAASSIQTTPYSNGFESNIDDWSDYPGPFTRVTSGTNGVTSATGDFHSEVVGGAFSRWGAYENEFPTDGYFTELDVYIDTNLADGSAAKRFDFSSAINNTANAHRRDFIIHAGTKEGEIGKWFVAASNNAHASELRHIMPSNSPVEVTESGWYTLQHEFNNNVGVLEVVMRLIRISDGSVVGTWVRSDAFDIIGSTVGGNRYGWLLNITFDEIQVDNARKNTVSVPTLPPPPKEVVNNEVVVTQGAMNGWEFVEEAPLAAGQVGAFVSGPGTAPIGVGSAQFTLVANSGLLLGAPLYTNTRLSDVTALSYQTYRVSGDASLAPALQINIDNDLTDTNTNWQGRLVFEPYHSGTVSTGTWQEWNTLTQSGWFFSNGILASTSGCSMATPCTWDEVLTKFPNAGIHATLGAVGFKAGSGGSWANGFVGNVDKFVIGIENATTIQTTTFDFEPDTTKPVTEVVSPIVGGVYSSGTTTLNLKSTDAGTGIALAVANIHRVVGTSTVFVAPCANNTVSPTEAEYDFTCAINIDSLTEGSYVVRANARDGANNLSNTISWAFGVDKTAPTVTVKPESVGDEATMTFTEVSFKLFDAQKIDKVIINGTVKDLTNNNWSDVNGVKPGVFGAVLGPNTMVVYDVAGNTTTVEFTLVIIPDTPTPTASLTITNPVTAGEVLSGEFTFTAEYIDYDDVDDQMFWAIRAGRCNGVDQVGNAPASPFHPSTFNASTGQFSATVDMSSWDSGTYCLVVNPRESSGPDFRETRLFTLESTSNGGGEPSPDADTIAPLVEVTNVFVSTDKKLSFDLTATDENSGLRHIAANIYNENNTGSVLVAIGSGNPTRLNVPHSGLPEGTPSFATSTSDIDVSDLPDGTYTIRAFARDHAGNGRYITVQFVISTPDDEVTPPAPTSSGGRALTGRSSQASEVLGVSTSAPEGEVLGASTTAGTCGMYLLEYMSLGNAPSVWEVMKLQLFLVSRSLATATSGVFDLGTESAVKAYQAANASAILDPWVTAGLATTLSPTGNVYKTTRWHINNAVCPGSESFPVLP